MDFHFLLMELWPQAKAEGIPDVIRAEDAGSTENVFSYEYEGSDLCVLLPSLRPGTVSPTPAFRLGLEDPRRNWVLYIPKVIRAEDAGSTENVFSYEYERSDLRVLLPSVRPGTVSPTPAFRLGLEDPRSVWALAPD